MLSPMCDFSTVVSGDLLRSIFERLPLSDLARSACVCRSGRDFASDREMQERIFRSPWQVCQVLGEPSSPAFWRYPSLDRFAIFHRLSRGDSVAGLALRYDVQDDGILQKREGKLVLSEPIQDILTGRES